MKDALNRTPILSPYFAEIEEVPAPGRYPMPQGADDADSETEDFDDDDEDYEADDPMTSVPGNDDSIL